MKKIKIIFTLLLMIMLAACKKEIVNNPKPKELPPITTEGKNTFGCKVDGEVWIPTGWWYESAIFADYWHGNLVIKGSKVHESVSFYIGNILFKEGEYVLKKYDDTTGNGSYRLDNFFCFTNNTYTGKLTLLRLDTINFIVSGTFYFDAIDSETGKVVHVTDGRFDIKYH